LNETTAFSCAGILYTVTIGFYPDGRPGEVFADGARTGSMTDAVLDDACIALSLLLQFGVEPAALVHSMGRSGDGRTPASVIGALADLLAEARHGG